MIRVTAPSRLHFGLFALLAEGVTHWPGADGQPALPARHFCGIGLMIDQPGVQVTVRPAAAWTASGPSSERALFFAQRFTASMPDDQRDSRFEIVVERCAPEHVGLGTGTQLALAVARALALATGYAHWNAAELARHVGRGLRSSLGIHGFEQGGLLVEGGKTAAGQIAPLVARQPFPDEWQILLMVTREQKGTHGAEEREAFAQLAQRERDLRRSETLCRLTLLGLLPALAERDLPAFGEALYEFNRRAGEWFLPWQGGPYADALTETRIASVRRHGIRGVGQSSWGPTVFAVERRDVLQRLRQELLDQGEFHDDELLLCRASNQGVLHSQG
mgnify:CR=1 FL=1